MLNLTVGSFLPTQYMSDFSVSAGEFAVSAIAGGLAVIFALCMLLCKRAVYSAISLIGVMICLAVLYTAQEAPFMGVVQIVVYTGAIMMLILFVLMLVGIDSADSPGETLRGHRAISIFAGLVLGVGLLITLGGVGSLVAKFLKQAKNFQAQPVSLNTDDSNPVGIALKLFADHVFTLELVGTLLIIAALGAMTLTHHEDLGERKSQLSVAAAKMKDYAENGGLVGMYPPPGVFAESNSAANPALGPSEEAVMAAVPTVLVIRGQEHSLEAASPSTAKRQQVIHNVEVSQSGLPGMPGAPAVEFNDPLSTTNKLVAAPASAQLEAQESNSAKLAEKKEDEQ